MDVDSDDKSVSVNELSLLFDGYVERYYAQPQPSAPKSGPSPKAEVVQSTKAKRVQPYVRRNNTTNRMTRLGASKVYYSDDNILGRGATAWVYKGYFGDPTRKCAVKRIPEEGVDIYENEIKIWSTLEDISSPENINIIRLFDHLKYTEGEEGSVCHYFAMELADCDLEQQVKLLNNSSCSEIDYMKSMKRYLHDCSRGLQWIHTKRIIHRDIKPKNILIFKDRSDQQEIAKLGDFGISRKLSGTSTGTDSLGKGTSDWMAPEAVSAMTHGTKLDSTRALDIFSFGMTASYAISKGHHPFETSQLYGKMVSMNIKDPSINPTFLPNEAMNAAANHLLQWMMQHEVDKRPKIEQVVAHPFSWDTKYSFDFVVDVAKAFAKEDTVLSNIRNAINVRYKNYFKKRENRKPKPENPNFNWQNIIGDPVDALILTRTDRVEGKKYKSGFLMDLVELIRDKAVHYPDLHPDLLKDKHFGVNNSFNETKFAEFMLNKFPDLVIFLFCEILNAKCSVLATVKWKYCMKITGKVTVPSLSLIP